MPNENVPTTPAPSLPKTKNPTSVKTLLLIVAGVLFTAAAFGLGYLYSNQQKPKSPVTLPVTSTPSPNSTFTGQKLKISFNYPSEWGSVKEEITPIGDAQNYHGNNYRLSFSNNPYITMTGASKDSSSPGVGGACPIRQFFKGTPETGILSCSQCNKESEGCGGCQQISVSNQQAVEYLYRPTSYCAMLGFQKIVYLKTPFDKENADFPGLVIVLSITSQQNSNLSDTGYRSVASCPGDGAEAEQQRQYLANIFNQNRQELETSLLSSQPTDYLSKQQLTELNNLLSSFHFLE